MNENTPPTLPCNQEAIFVVSSFRTASTWLWDKLRRHPNCLAYYEIFNEMLGSFDGRTASNVHYAGTYWTSMHPPSAPYFLEFLPLSKDGGGVTAYDASMACESFIPTLGIDGSLSESERNYLALLIDHAHSLTKVPVLTCTRTLGRARAIKKEFPCKLILVYRNLFHQWASYSHQFALGNPYFIQTINKTIASCAHDPFIKGLDDWFASRVENPADESMFQVFLLLHLYLYSRAYDVVDLLIDVNAISENSELLRQTESDLLGLFNAAVDLSDVRPTFEYSSVELKSFSAFEDSINQFTKVIIGDISLSSGAIAFVNQVKTDMFKELKQHEFYVRGHRALEAGQVKYEHATIDTLEQKLATITQEKESLAAELSQALINQNRLKDQDRGRLLTELNQLSVNLKDAREKLSSPVAEISAI